MHSEIEKFSCARAAWLFVVVGLGSAALLPANALAVGILLGLAALVVFVRIATTHEGVRARMLALSVLLVLQLGFWIAFAHIVALARTVAQVESARALELSIMAPLIVLAPVAVWSCKLLDARGLEPSPAAKISLGFLCLAASCTCLAACVEASPSTVSLGAVAGCLAVLTIAALSVGPTCVAAIVELAPEQRGAGLAGWALSYAFARAIGTWAHAPSVSLDLVFDACLALGFGTLAAAVLSSFMWHGLQTAHSFDGSVGSGSVDSVGSPSLGSVGSGSLVSSSG